MEATDIKKIIIEDKDGTQEIHKKGVTVWLEPSKSGDEDKVVMNFVNMTKPEIAGFLSVATDMYIELGEALANGE